MSYSTFNIHNLVRDEVSKQLQPSLFESLIRHHMLRTEIENAVIRQLPKTFNAELSSRTGLLASFVQSELPNILSQQHYYLDALTKQRDEFNVALQKQVEQFDKRHQTHLLELDTASINLIKQNIKNVSKQSNVLGQIETNIKNESKDYLDDKMDIKAKELNEYFNYKIKVGMAFSGLIGAIFGLGASFLIK